MAVILIIYFLPGKSIPKIGFLENLGVDKLAHITVFLGLGFVFLAYKSDEHRCGLSKLLIVMLLSTIYGGILEYLQGKLLEDRTSDIWDFIANFIGIVLGVFLFKKFYMLKLRTNKKTY